jgi:hypothetical protein
MNVFNFETVQKTLFTLDTYLRNPITIIGSLILISFDNKLNSPSFSRRVLF